MTEVISYAEPSIVKLDHTQRSGAEAVIAKDKKYKDHEARCAIVPGSFNISFVTFCLEHARDTGFRQIDTELARQSGLSPNIIRAIGFLTLTEKEQGDIAIIVTLDKGKISYVPDADFLKHVGIVLQYAIRSYEKFKAETL